LLQFMQALADCVASPAEAVFSLAGIAATQFKSDFGDEEPALVTTQPLGGSMQQGVVRFAEDFRDGVSGVAPGSSLAHFLPSPRL